MSRVRNLRKPQSGIRVDTYRESRFCRQLWRISREHLSSDKTLWATVENLFRQQLKISRWRISSVENWCELLSSFKNLQTPSPVDTYQVGIACVQSSIISRGHLVLPESVHGRWESVWTTVKNHVWMDTYPVSRIWVDTCREYVWTAVECQESK